MMKTIIRLSLGSVVLAGPLLAALVFADPPSGRLTGKVLVLDNQHTLQGEIERRGDLYIIKVGGGGEMTLPAHQALHLCANWDDAFAFMQSQANLHDPDERMRLANWCDANGLHDHAVAEATRAVEMRPTYAPGKQLLARLERASRETPTPNGRGATTPPDLATPPITDLSGECLALFNTRVQPILMNTCASCHAGGKGGEFKLMRCEDATINRRAAQFNLAAVVAQIHFDRPEVSPLLYKSLSKHGNMAQAPLQGRDTVPFQLLQQWVQMTVANNPHLRKEAPAKLAITAAPAAVAPVAAPLPAPTPPPSAFGANAPVVPTLTPGMTSSGKSSPEPVFAENQSPTAVMQNPTEIRQALHEVQALRPAPELGPEGVCSPNKFNDMEHPNR